MLRAYLLPIVLLVISNLFMTLAWYGHLKFEEWGWVKKTTLVSGVEPSANKASDEKRTAHEARSEESIDPGDHDHSEHSS